MKDGRTDKTAMREEKREGSGVESRSMIYRKERKSNYAIH